MAAAQTKLTHLFQAHMRNGDVIQQTVEDRSVLEPETRSCFYDVAQRLQDVEVFALIGPDHFYIVDLRDGHFEIDDISFKAQPCSTPHAMPPGGKYTLIYFRDHEQDIQVTGTVLEDMSVDERHAMGEHRIAYRIGWRYTVGERFFEQTIVVK